MIKNLGLIFHKLMCITVAAVFSLTPVQVKAAPNSISKSATLYSNGHPVTGESGEIVSIAASEKGLFFASFAGFTNIEGGKTTELHVWNVLDPSNPALIGRLDMSDPGEDGEPDDPSLLAPRDMKVIKDHLVFWRNFELFVYSIAEDGALQQVFRGDFADDLNTGLSRLSHGAYYATSERQLLTNNQFLRLIDILPYDEAEDRISENVLFNFQNPAAPFIVQETQPLGKNFKIFDPAPNGALNGLPARLTLDDAGETLSLLYTTQARTSHLTNFWVPVLSQVFKKRSLNRTLANLAELITNALSPEKLARDINRLLQNGIDLPLNATLAARASTALEQGALLSAVLDSFGVDESDSVQFALEKIVSSTIDAELESALSTEIIDELFDEWLKALFGSVPRSLRQLSDRFAGAFNGRLKQFGIERYLVNAVIGPLIDLPPAFRVRLRTLISAVEESAFGEALTTSLSSFNAIIPANALIKSACRAIDVKVPRCLRIPESARQFLSLLLTTGGARLDLDNLAFIELLKLVAHYNGDTNYAGLIRNIQEQIRTLHVSLSGDLTVNLFKGLDLSNVIGDRIGTLRERIRETVDVRPIIIKSIVAGILNELASENISASQSVREVLEARNLYTEVERLPAGASLATNAELSIVLGNTQIGSITLGTLLHVTGAAQASALNTGVAEFRTELSGVVHQLWQRVFGAVPGDTTLGTALKGLISKSLNPATVADIVENLIGETLSGIANSTPLSSLLETADRAAQGNCIAQYQTVLLAISAVPLIGEVGIAAEFALAQAQDAGIDFALDYLLSQFISAIFDQAAQHFPSWDLKLSTQTVELALNQLTDQQAQNIDAFLAGDRIGVVLRDVGSFGWSFGDDRNVQIVIADPLDIANTVTSISTDNWDLVRSVISHELGYLLIGGERLNSNEIPESAVVLVNFLEEGAPTYELSGEAADDLRAAQELAVLNSAGIFAASTIGGQVVLFSNYGR